MKTIWIKNLKYRHFFTILEVPIHFISRALSIFNEFDFRISVLRVIHLIQHIPLNPPHDIPPNPQVSQLIRR